MKKVISETMGMAADADRHGLVDGAPEHAVPAQGRDEEHAQRAAGDFSESAHVGNASLGSGADRGCPLHHVIPSASCSVWQTRKIRITWVSWKTLRTAGLNPKSTNSLLRR